MLQAARGNFAWREVNCKSNHNSPQGWGGCVCHAVGENPNSFNKIGYQLNYKFYRRKLWLRWQIALFFAYE